MIVHGQVPTELNFEFIKTENYPKVEYATHFNNDAQGNLWISSLRGLFKFDGYRSDLYVHDPNDSLSLANNRVFSTFLSHDGELWVCAARGVQKYNRENGNFETRLKDYIQSQIDLYDISFNCALDLDSDRLLIGFKRGLLIYNKLTDEVEKIDSLHHKSERDAFSYSTHVLEMVEDNIDSDIVWLLTRAGLYKYKKSEKKAELIQNKLNIDFLNNQNRGHSLAVLGNEVLLVSNYFYVYSYHKLNQNWTALSGQHNVSKTKNKYIRNIVSVADEYALIVYIDKGIEKYIAESNVLSPLNTFFEMGLSENEFSNGVIDANGYLIFVNGTENYIKSKKKLVPVQRKPQLVLSDLRINSNKVSDSSFYKEKMVLKNYERSIQFKLGVSYPDLKLPIKYFYTHDKKRQSWTPIPNDRKVDLVSLGNGDHTLYGKVEYGDEEIEQEILSFSIEPYFYETWWFRSLFLVIIGLIGYLFFWQYRSRIQEKQEYNTTLLGFQMNALRSQMNPHFLFNSLNSIKNYMVNKGPDEAAEYLTRFSLLIRKILENSRKKLLSLEDEIEMLDLYIEMEKKRFSEKFSYKLEVDESIDQTHFFLAPMIIQPYIENAIWHGLMNKEAERNLSVRFLLSDENVICYIVDNGIGRLESRKRNMHQNSSKKSLGMEITGDHIVAINKLYQINAKVDIEDCYDQKGNPTGTKVKVFLPRLQKN